MYKNSDYEVKYSDNPIKKGRYYVLIIGEGKYSGKVLKEYVITSARKIKKIKLSYTKIKLEKTSFTYTGKDIKPRVTVTYQGKNLVDGRDYTLSYSDNRNAGTGKVTIQGKGEYTGNVTKKFTIKRCELKDAATVTLSQYSYTYDGDQHSPEVIVKHKKKSYNVEYKVLYPKDTRNVGLKCFFVIGEGNYTGIIKSYYRINKCPVDNLAIEVKDCIYDPTQINQKAEIRMYSRKKINKLIRTINVWGDYSDDKFDIKVSNNKNVGTGKVKITGKGNYTGTVTKTFKIYR